MTREWGPEDNERTEALRECRYAIARAEVERDTLRTENERLREALKWYAEPTNWLVEALPTGGAATRIDLDRGDRARTALGEDGKNG